MKGCIYEKNNYFLFFMMAYLLMELVGAEGSEGIYTFKIFYTDNSSKYEGKQIDLFAAKNLPALDYMKNQDFLLSRGDPFNFCTAPSQFLPMISDMPNEMIIVDGDESECSLYTKIALVKSTGARGIVLLSKNKDIPKQIFSDGSFLIFMAYNEYSISALNSSERLIGTLTPKSDIDYKKAKIQLWISSLEPKSYELLKIFSEALNQIPQLTTSANWKVRHALWGCNSYLGKCQYDQQYMESCACSGEFCSPQKYVKASDAVIKEDIRQKIIFDNYFDYFFNYTQTFNKKCLSKFKDSKYAQDCAEMVLNQLNMNISDIQGKLDIFMKGCSGNLFEELLVDRNRFNQIGYYPMLLLNRNEIQFKNKKDLETQLCRQLLLEGNESCSNVIKSNKVIYITTHILIPLLIAIGIGALIVVLIRKFKKNLNRTMDKQMKMQMQVSVAKYFTLQESK